KGFQPFYSNAQATEDQSTTAAADLLPENAINGLVEDRAGNPIPGAHVVATRPTPSGQAEEHSVGKSDSSGSLRVGSLGEGTYTLQVHAAHFADATLVTEVNRSVTVELQRLGGISGQVLAAGTGEPVNQFEVRWKLDGRAASRVVLDPKGRE